MSYCPSCGAEVGEEDHFCRVCGEALVELSEPTVREEEEREDGSLGKTSSADVADAVVVSESATTGSGGSEVPPAGGSRSSRRWLIPVIVVIALAAAVAVVWWYTSRSSADDARQARSAASTAIKPFQKLDSSLTVGLTYDDYSSMTQDAQYALDAYSPSDNRGKRIRAHLSTAMSAYKAAYDAWNADIEGEFKGNKKNAGHWTKQCPELADELLWECLLTASDVEQAGWAVAQKQLAAAKTFLSQYDTAK